MSLAMISNTSPLVVLDYPAAEHLMYLELVLLTAVSLAIFILLVGSQLHKMIGL